MDFCTLAYEVQTMNQCKQCKEAVTNPVCPECLERQIEDWLLRRRPEIVSELKEKTDKHVFVESGKTKCIICDKRMDICSYCYTEDLFHWLKEVDTSLLSEFLTYFDFDERNQGYRKEAEQMGITV